jgi:hypothetical protein
LAKSEVAAEDGGCAAAEIVGCLRESANQVDVGEVRLPAHEVSAHELRVKVRGRGPLIDRVQITPVEVLAESDRLAGDLLVEVQRRIVQNQLRRRALDEDAGPEAANLGSFREPTEAICGSALLTGENVTGECDQTESKETDGPQLPVLPGC